MGTRSDIIVHRADGKWARIYCHWDGYLEHNGQILFDHYTSQNLAEQLVAGGNLSILGKDCTKKPRGHSFDKHKPGYCVYYIRDRGHGDWHYAKSKAEFLEAESAELGDTLQAVWPAEDTWTEFTYVWDQDKWWVTSPDEGTQTLIDLGDALQGKATTKFPVKVFGAVIGQHGKSKPGKDHNWSGSI